MISSLDISIIDVSFKKMDGHSELVNKDVIIKLESYIRQYGIDKDDNRGSIFTRTIKVETSGCIIKFCIWWNNYVQILVIRFDKNTHMMFYGPYTGHVFTEENMLYYAEKMNHDAVIVCAKSDMPASAKVEFVSVAMALFGAKDGKFTKKAR